MSDHVCKIVERVGTSTAGTDDGIPGAIETAAGTLRHTDGFEVTESRGHVAGAKVADFQVTVKPGSRLEA